MDFVSLLIKPASGRCNLQCKYCFYKDEMKNREQSDYGLMSEQTAQSIIDRAFDVVTGQITFAFQGGEPTLAGIEFYKKFCEYIKERNVKRLKVNYVLQTNGTLIDDLWAEFFQTNDFLVGISIDGSRSIHNQYRVDQNGEGSFKNVLRAARLLDSNKVRYNILSVLTDYSSQNIEIIYNFFKSKGFFFQQYIPCIYPITQMEGTDIVINSDNFAKAQKILFDLWYKDITTGIPIYNRYFENLLGIISGNAPESCDMVGNCSVQFVIEADGSVYPCDFYVLDKYLLGNINQMSLEELQDNQIAQSFIEESKEKNPKCTTCKWVNLCRGGCRRFRDFQVDKEIGLNYYCEAYKDIFEYIIDKIKKR